MKKKYKATVALAISVLGAGATMSWPASYGFWGGMLHNGFLAATIGGMADWFAVTAIFRKPLGISYKTEIIINVLIILSVIKNNCKEITKKDNGMASIEYLTHLRIIVNR